MPAPHTTASVSTAKHEAPPSNSASGKRRKVPAGDQAEFRDGGGVGFSGYFFVCLFYASVASIVHLVKRHLFLRDY